MKRADLLTAAATWEGESWAERIDQCASMLFCHGYIPLSQREKIARKLQAEFDAAREQADLTATVVNLRGRG